MNQPQVNSGFTERVTPLVLTYNEAANLGRTLGQLTSFPNVLVLDSFSDDETVAIARSYPNVTLVQRAFDSFADQCNFGLSQIETPWVLSLDADYVLTDEVIAEVRALQPDEATAGFRVSFRYCVFGRPLRSTIYPARTVLYRRERAHYRNEGHGHRVQVEGVIVSLQNRIRHDDRKPLGRWLESQDRYMQIEARTLLQTAPAELNFADRLRKRVVVAPPAVFLYLLFVRGLILDGWPGWFYVFQRTLAETLLSLRLIIQRNSLEENG